MRMPARLFRHTTIATLLAATPLVAQTGPRFEVSFARSAHPDPITGRVYVAISRDSSGPIRQTGVTGVPLFGVNVDNLAAGTTATIDVNTFGFPARSLRDIPAGTYWVQPFVNVYTKFARADGHTVWLHMDQWEGQNWKNSPGNIFGKPVKITFDPQSTKAIALVADQVIPAVTVPADNYFVKHVKIQSQILTKWWGHPIFLGAVVLLPRDYDKHPDVKYPIVYDEGHFSLRAPGGFTYAFALTEPGRAGANPPGASPAGGRGGRGGAGGSFTEYWLADSTPRMIVATLQHPSPYYDDSYGVNSENNGPYGDAITQELIPAVETQFRAIRQPWARLLTGGSTGGWISLAHQVMYPDLYGGTWSLCPDGVDFRYHQIVNIYADSNAYWINREWMRVDRPGERRPDGNVTYQMSDENWYELAVGDHSRSGGQWDIWEATYGPVGSDGYPRRIWNKTTGVIDHAVAEYWKQHYDLRSMLETNWATLGPKVANNINVYVGDADSYFLNMGVHKLDEFFKAANNPTFGGEVVFQPMAPHCWGPGLTDLIPKMAAHLEKFAPAGSDLKAWRY